MGNFEGMQVREGSMGKPAPGMEMAILGPTGVLGVGEEGEIVVRCDRGGGMNWIFKGTSSPSSFPFYLHLPGFSHCAVPGY